MTRKMNLPVWLLVLSLSACSLPVFSPRPTPTSVPSGTPVPATVTPLPPVDTATAAELPTAAAPQITWLHMLDASTGWAGGAGSLLRTSDGGASWEAATPAGVSSQDVIAGSYFLDARDAWFCISAASQTSGNLYQTTDGGRTWSSRAVPFGGATLHFVDPTDGWALAELGAGMSHEAVAVFRTQDGGQTWKQVFTDDPTVSGSSDSLPFVGDKNGLTALDGQRAWVTGAQPSSDFIYVYLSQDGGASWQHQALAMPKGYSGAMTNAFLPAFFASSRGVLPVGMYADQPGMVFYLSSDGGLTWKPSTPVALNGQVAIGSPKDFFVWDGGAALSVSHDAGATWTSIAPNLQFKDTLVSFQFIDATTGWAITADASNHYALYRSTDGGSTWLPLIP